MGFWRGEARIPGKFARITWERLGELHGPDGPALGGVELHDGRSVVGPAAVRELRARIGRAAKVVLIGETSAGKSVSAAAWLDEALRAGVERARWVSALSLREPEALTRGLGALVGVLDGVGEELHQAGEGSGLIAQRCVPACEFWSALAEQRPVKGRRWLVTTYLDFVAMARLYGGNIARRCYEGAEVVRLRRVG